MNTLYVQPQALAITGCGESAAGRFASALTFPIQKTPMKLAVSELTIGEFLDYLEQSEPKKIYLNHMVIENHVEDIITSLPVSHLPSFTVEYDGFMDVEFFLDYTQSRVVRISVRQSAMTFFELEQNGEVLPTITIACAVLPEGERVRLSALARVYSEQGRLQDKETASNLLKEYVAKSAFCPQKYGGTKHA